MKEINNLLDSLATLVKNNDGTIYVLSSTSRLNDEILRSACRSYTHTPAVCKNILFAHHVDKRDGFPFQFLTARYVVIADPIQYHLRPEDQRVVGILADEILNQRGIGLSFRALNYNFTLDNNVKAYIFEKITPFRRSDLDQLSRLFLTHYPDKKELFTIDSGICDLIIKKEIGDVAGEIVCQRDFVFIHPGINTPSRLFLKLHREYRSLKMLLAFRDPEKIPLSCRAIDGEIDLTMNADGKTIFQKNIDHTHPMSYQLDIRGLDVLEIRVDKGRNGPDCDWFMLKNIELN
jgi:hypothetical protein